MTKQLDTYFWATTNKDSKPFPFNRQRYRDLWLDCIDEPGEVRKALSFEEARLQFSLSSMLRAVKTKYPENRKSRVPGLLMKGVNTNV